MTFRQFIWRNLRFHSRAHLGVVLGAAIGSAALIGALVVGDSVRESLTDMALRRLGKIHFALTGQDRLFQASLVPRLRAAWLPGRIGVGSKSVALIKPNAEPVQSSALALPGIVSRQDGTARANGVRVLGVDGASWPRLANWGGLSPGVWVSGPEGARISRDGVTMMHLERGKGPLSRWQAGETAFINIELARQLAAREGDEIILRVRKPSALGLDAAISPRSEDAIALRLKVGAIVPADMLGDFSLMA
jgi:putative ABC transport system permease protein